MGYRPYCVVLRILVASCDAREAGWVTVSLSWYISIERHHAANMCVQLLEVAMVAFVRVGK